MDQFPLGKGKRVWLIPTDTASIVLFLYTNNGVLWIENFPVSLPAHFEQLSFSMLHIHCTRCDICSVSRTHRGAGHGTDSTSLDHTHTVILLFKHFIFPLIPPILLGLKHGFTLTLIISVVLRHLIHWISFFLQATVGNLSFLSQYRPIQIVQDKSFQLKTIFHLTG